MTEAVVVAVVVAEAVDEAEVLEEAVAVAVAEKLGLVPLGSVLPPVFTEEPTAAHPEEEDVSAPYVLKELVEGLTIF